MNRLLIICFIFLVQNLMAQVAVSSIKTNEKSFEIYIDKIKYNYEERKNGRFKIRNYIDYHDELNPDSYKLPTKDLIIAIPPNSSPKFRLNLVTNDILENTLPASNKVDFQISNQFYDKYNFENNTLTDIKVLGYFWHKNVYCAHIKFPLATYLSEHNRIVEYKSVSIEVDISGSSKIIAKNDDYKIDPRLKSEYNLITNWKMAEQFKVVPTPSKSLSDSNWINKNANYAKLGIIHDGLYRLSGADLISNNIFTSIGINSIELFESGEPVPALIVDENNNLIFDSEDYVEFYATKNYSKQNYLNEFGPQDEYIPYLNRYSDTAFYFFAWGNKEGLKINLEEELTPSGLDTLNYYTDFTHFENNTGFMRLSVNKAINQDPLWLNTDLWHWRGIGIGEASFNFSVDNYVIDKTASVYAKLVGAASDRYNESHNVSMHINNSSVDSASINRNANLLLGGDFNSTNLSAGNNILKIINNPNGSLINSLSFDWFEIRYPRTLMARDDSLTFEFSDAVTDEITRTVEINNFISDSAIIYQIAPNVSKISSYVKNNTSIFFNDTISAASKYIIVSKNKILTPIIYGQTQFKDLKTPLNNFSHLTITHSKLAAASNIYSQYIQEHYEIESSVVDVKDIFNEFSYGYPDPAGIKEYLKYLHSYWPTPNLKYLFFIGTASYDSKNYLNKSINENLVPSYGEPVSDVWYTLWDTTGALIPQMAVGRLSAENEEEVLDYLEKHKNNNSGHFDEFNKRALFFSGGDGNLPGELDILKTVNDFIIDNYAHADPLALQTSHFYKTITPQSDFGPYDFDFINDEIKRGGIFISYIGHSGTRTWDNSISEPEQLDNEAGKSSLISDFGCSTNKFAEPDIDCFSTLFLKDGLGIGYIGNSSLGYLSTATNVSKYFYESILVDSIYTIGDALTSSKEKLLTRLGSSGVYRIFVYTNQLAGDPIVSLPFPQKVNLVNQNNLFKISKENITDIDDSISITIPIINHGIVQQDSFNVKITANWNGIETIKNIRLIVPEYQEDLTFSIPIKDKAGKHNLLISYDSENEIDEISEDDNNSELTFNVSSTQIRSLFGGSTSVISDKIILLNPSELNNFENIIELELDTLGSFTSSKTHQLNFDTLKTIFELSDLINSKRYWLRSRLLNNENWNSSVSFIKDAVPVKYQLSDSISFSTVTKSNLKLDYDKLILSKDSVTIEIQSSGGDVAKYGAVFKDGINVLPNTFNWGMGIAVFDTSDLSVDTAMTVWYGSSPDEAARLADYIISIPDGKLVAMNVIDDGSSNLTSDLKAAIKTLGSTKVDSISFRGPWALLSIKGGLSENIIEVVQTREYPNIIIIGNKYNVTNKFGVFNTSIIGPSAKWNKITVAEYLLDNSKINYRPILITENESSDDTLSALNIVDGMASLEFINAKLNPYIKILTEFNSGSNAISPVLNSLGVDHLSVPELAINYQVVSLERDTLNQGDSARLSFFVYNVGEFRADSFKVIIELIKPNNLKDKIFEEIVDSLGAEKRKRFNFEFSTAQFNGPRSFSITIDSENKILEKYEDNNYYNVPFYVIGDSTKPSMIVSVDGNDIFDGEYISNKPEIKIELSDPSLIPITDTSSISMFLNNRYINYKGNEEVLSINYSVSNPKVVVNYSPTLEDGEYSLRVFGQDASGNIGDSSGIIKNFNVESNAKLLNVYNYPNPFTNDTYFTFKLTQIPDEIKIKVFTIAGRLIKEFLLNSGQLNYDLNKVYWDGRDADGDKLGNGVYLYKVIMDVNGKKQDITQKLAVVR